MVQRENLDGRNLEYFDYIKDHISKVRKVWVVFRLRKDTNSLLADDFFFSQVDYLVNTHDDSKFSQYEFFGYRQKFYPYDKEEINEGYFLSAWNKHQKLNPHHWEYWVMPNKGELVPLRMSIEYILEMLMDWTAMSLVFKNTPSEWYFKNRANMILHEGTSSFVEKWISVFDEIYTGLVVDESILGED